MSASSLSLLIAALPLAFAAPYHRPKRDLPDYNCVQEPCPRPGKPSPSWSRGPFTYSSSSGAALPTGSGFGTGFGTSYGTGTGHGTGTAPVGTGTGYYPIQPTGSGLMSILPIDVSSSTLIYTNPIRSSFRTPVDEPIITTSPPPAAPTTPAPEKPTPAPEEPTPSPSPARESSADAVKSQFAASTTYDFSVAETIPASLWVATDFIGSEPLTHTFTKDNAYIADGFLVLMVPGGQAGKADISSAEVSTTFEIKYGSVRTWAILTEEPGVCNGMFFYKSDSQETDIEWISDPKSQSNTFANNGTRALQYTNQALDGVFEHKTSLFAKSPEDATSAVHEYRIDWFEDRTDYYTDGVFQHSIDTNVPNVAGPWVWNNWANGDKAWTADPPVNDAAFKIQKIEMYYNPA